MNTDHVESWEKKQREKQRRLKILGWIFLAVSCIAASLAYLVEMEFIGSWIFLSPSELEGYYMMSIVFGVLGLFCLKSTAKNQTTFTK